MFEIKKDDEIFCFKIDELVYFNSYMNEDDEFTIDFYLKSVDIELSVDFDNEEDWLYYISKFKEILETRCFI